MAARMTGAAFGWLTAVLIVRQLSPDNWGRYSFVFALLSFVGWLSDLQLSRVLLTDLSASEEPGRVLGSYMMFRLAIALVSTAVAIGFTLVGGYDSTVVIAVAIGCLQFFTGAIWVALALFCQWQITLRPAALTLVVGQLAQFAIVLVMVRQELGGLFAFVVVAVVADLARTTLMVVLLVPGTGIRLGIDFHRWMVWMREVAPLALATALGSVYFRIDLLILSTLGSLDDVGLYAAGYKIADLVGFIPLAMLASVLAILVRSWPDDPERFRRAVAHAFVILGILAVGIATAWALVAGHVLEVTYGERFRAGADAARLQMLGQSVHFFTLLAVTVLLAMNRSRRFLWASITGVVLNVGLNYAFIPPWSLAGAGWATVITELVVLALLARDVRSVGLPGLVPMRSLVKMLAGAGVLATTYWAAVTVAPWLVALALGLLMYIAVLHLTQVAGPGGLRAVAREASALVAPEEAATD